MLSPCSCAKQLPSGALQLLKQLPKITKYDAATVSCTAAARGRDMDAPRTRRWEKRLIRITGPLQMVQWPVRSVIRSCPSEAVRSRNAFLSPYRRAVRVTWAVPQASKEWLAKAGVQDC